MTDLDDELDPLETADQLRKEAHEQPPSTGESVVHVHEWQAQGLVREPRQSISPCSQLDDVLWTQVVAVQSCACGKVRRVSAGEENVRRRGDDLRRRSRR